MNKLKRLKLLNHNKVLLNKLNIEQKDYYEYYLMKELNKKYELNIKDVDTTKIELSEKELKEDVFEYFIKIHFKELKELYLNLNQISKINLLEKIKFEKLEILDLSSNNIVDISILEKINFKNLQILNLCRNYIEDIKVLERVCFKNLTE